MSEEKSNNNNKNNNNENIVRNMYNKIKQFFNNKMWNTLFGLHYTTLHYILICLGVFIMLFENDPYHLIILLIVITLDAAANIFTHDCPLTMLEQKYLHKSLTKDRKKMLKKSKIVYKCNHIYESQLEVLINVWSMTAAKIFFILSIRCFQKYIVKT